MTWMPSRTYEPEVLDNETPPPETLGECYEFLKRTNRWLGGVRATLGRFRRFSRRWAPGERIRVLDVATGAADIPRALVKWARSRGFDLTVTALDLDPAALDFARRDAGRDGIHYLCSDVLRMPCLEGSFDYVISSLFFHHLTDEQVLVVLRAFDRIARRGIVVNDLIRRWRAWFWTKVFTVFSNSILQNDGPLSVRKSLTVGEAEDLVARAGLPYLRVRTHFGHRMTISGEKIGPPGSLRVAEPADRFEANSATRAS